MHHEAVNQLNKLLFSIIPTPFYILLQIALLSRDFLFKCFSLFFRTAQKERKKEHLHQLELGQTINS